jgi:hypothetical protein
VLEGQTPLCSALILSKNKHVPDCMKALYLIARGGFMKARKPLKDDVAFRNV